MGFVAQVGQGELTGLQNFQGAFKGVAGLEGQVSLQAALA